MRTDRPIVPDPNGRAWKAGKVTFFSRANWIDAHGIKKFETQISQISQSSTELNPSPETQKQNTPRFCSHDRGHRKRGTRSDNAIRQSASGAPRTQRSVAGMDAPLSARGRGQVPKPRCGASKTPGLRSATGRKTMRPAVHLRPHVVHQTGLATEAGIDTASATTGAGYGNQARLASNASGAR